MPQQPLRSCTPRLPGALRAGRPGFTFTEILFAVMILGIGFIMVAAMFPVAIKQTESAVEETTAANIGKEALNFLATPGIATNANLPPTNPSAGIPNGVVVALASSNAPNNPFWNLCAGNMILPVDNRYAWIPFYSRNLGQAYALVTVVVVMQRNSSAFTGNDLLEQGVAAQTPLTYPYLTGQTPMMVGCPNLAGHLMLATFALGPFPANGARAPTTADQVIFSSNVATPGNAVMVWPGSPPITVMSAGLMPDPQNSNANLPGCIAEGAYLIVADDSNVIASLPPNASASSPPQYHPPGVTCNGNIYRVGEPVPGRIATWELMPGNDMQSAKYKPIGGTIAVWAVGSGYNLNSNNLSKPSFYFAGPAMGIGAFSGVIPINH